jgi:hypothetical protein
MTHLLHPRYLHPRYPLPSLMPPLLNPLDQAAEFIASGTLPVPSAAAIVTALLAAEKAAKQQKVASSYQQLLGNWRLGFVTGTKRSRQRAGVVLGAGRFLPGWVKIQISYSQGEPGSERGLVTNAVEFGLLRLVLTGPTRWRSPGNILAFDFTQMKVAVAGRTLYSGYIRGGQEREANFDQQRLKEQAFFTYFLVNDQYIAARGKGGGLALWVREDL